MKIYSEDIPVYKIAFPDQSAYEQFKKLLIKQFSYDNVDTTNKVVYRDDLLIVEVYYFPRIFRGFADDFFIERCRKNNLLVPSFDFTNPFDIFDDYLNPEYKERQNHDFEEMQLKGFSLVKKNKDEPNRFAHLQVDKKEGSYEDYCNFMDKLLLKSFALGSKHGHSTYSYFLNENMALFGERNFKTIFTEGISYEAQPLLDTFLNSNEEKVSGELKCILEWMKLIYFDGDYLIKMVENAKRCGIRIVGLETQSSHMEAPRRELEGPPYTFNRIRAFNFKALEIIYRELGGNIADHKFIIETGADHTLLGFCDKTLPGFAHLLNIPGLVMYDQGEKDKYSFLSGENCDYAKKRPILDKDTHISFDILIATHFASKLKIEAKVVKNNILPPVKDLIVNSALFVEGEDKIKLSDLQIKDESIKETMTHT